MGLACLRAGVLGTSLLLAGSALAGPTTPSKSSATRPAGSPGAGATAASTEPANRGLDFSVSEQGPGLPWRMSIVNRSHEPSLLIADPTLLWFDIRVPGDRHIQTCRLPHGLFPSHADKRAQVVLLPGEGVVHSFDPRLYCFASGGQWRLVPGAFISPHFGWPGKKHKVWRHGHLVEEHRTPSPPFVAGPPPRPRDNNNCAGTDNTQHRVKALEAKAFALRSTYADWSSTRIGKDTCGPATGPLALTVSRGSDASTGRNATLVLRLKNRSNHGVHLFLRRELISFEIMGPDGLETCDPQPDLRAPARQAFLYLRKGHSITFTSRLVELCPHGTFARPGLYLVHARYDATHSGARFGLHAFVGRVASREPGSIRIRHGVRPFMMKRRMRRVRTSASSAQNREEDRAQ